MKGSLAASLGFHAAILVAALVVLPNPKHEVKPVEAITVDISNISDVNKIMAMSKTAEKPVEKPAPKKAEVVKKVDPTLEVDKVERKAAKEQKAPPPPPKPEPKPEPKKPEPKKPEPKPEPKKEEPAPPDPEAMAKLMKTLEEPPPPKKKEEPKKEEQKKAEKKPEKKQEKKPEKKQEAFDPDAVAQLLQDLELNKENEKKTTTGSPGTNEGNPAPGEKELQGQDATLSATAGAALGQRISQCWVVPPGALDAVELVKVRVQFNRDGSVVDSPQVVNGPGDFIFDTTARSAVAAILNCQNYDFLPADEYDAWKDVILNLYPRNASNSTPTQ